MAPRASLPLSLSLSLLLLLPSLCTSSSSRLAELKSLRKRSPDGVIRLDDNSFKKFGQGEDRPYSLFIFFDAKDLRDQNPDLNLADLRLEFGYAAKASMAGGREEGGEEGEGEDKEVFFAEMEFRHSQNTFRTFDIESLPHMRIVFGQNSKKSEDMRPDQSPRTAEGMANFVQQKTGSQIGPIVRPPFLSPFQVTVIVLFFLALTPLAIRYVLTHKTILHDSRLWCFGGFAIYFFSISGGMYNIIRSMPMYGRDRSDPSKYNYWYPGNGAQFGAEGFSIGILYCTVGLLLALVTFVAPKIKSTTAQRVVVYACVATSVACARQVVKLDQWKTGYQIHAFYPKSWR